MSSLFVLVDCNNFFASCERVFNPALAKRPVVILSNNDGCIIARSNEAKALGIPMGAPYYSHKALLEASGTAVFSSNYQLYGDMSSRIMQSLHLLARNLEGFVGMEVYSIDEAFIQLDCLDAAHAAEQAAPMRSRLHQWTGMPTSWGIAPTKTLAKLANHVAKQRSQPRDKQWDAAGVFDLTDPELQIRILSELPIDCIWGVAGGWSKKLKALGLHTVLDLREASPQLIRTLSNASLEKTIAELRGTCCFGLEAAAPKQSIISSRSFGQAVTDLASMQEALANYISIACEKLRKQKSCTKKISVMLQTSRFKRADQHYSNTASIGLVSPTADTAHLIRAGKQLLNQLYRSGYRYQKCGVVLQDLVPEQAVQHNLFAPFKSEEHRRLTQSVDRINETMGTGALFYAAQGIQRSWQKRSKLRSRRYTTQWHELPMAY
ncbi:MAG: Y-family DNA polymerase [Gammaproteobacteria bacterium]